MTRPLRAIAIAAVTLALSAGASIAPAQAPTQRRPNILIFITDDQRRSTVRYMPNTKHWFVRGGRNYLRAYATTPLCCPSRASIFTGRYVHNHGVENNALADTLDQRTTIQRYLQRAGYHTALIGRYLNRWPLEEDPPYFDEWAFFSTSLGHYYGGWWNLNGRRATVASYSTDFIARRTVKLLRERELTDRRPWMMFVATAAPHRPFTPKVDYARTRVARWRPGPAVYERDRSDKPPFVQEQRVPLDRMRRIRGRQIRTLLSVDDMVDRVFRVLGRLGERRRTLAIFLSDNGYMWGEHGLGTRGYAKRPPYRNSVAIPLLLRRPGHVLSGSSSTRLVANIDVAPTVLRAAGVAPDHTMDGIPLTGRRTRSRLLLEYFIDRHKTPEWASTQTTSSQYTEYYADDGQTVTFREFYDLRGDPWQLSNTLADGNPGNDPDVDLLSRRLSEDRRCRGEECP
jgi:arylsulfatase A-like enzyme